MVVVDSAVTPPYEVMVVYGCCIKTITIPVWPGAGGGEVYVAAVETAPYEVKVEYGCELKSTTVPV
jgi:hypothetical protein